MDPQKWTKAPRPHSASFGMGSLWDRTPLGSSSAMGSLLAVRKPGCATSIPRVIRGSLVSLDDTQNNNLIFIGSPVENLSLLDIPSTHHFVFQRATSGPRKGDIAIVNVHPRADEPRMFFGSPSSTPVLEDYAIVGLVPGMNSARSVLILAGTNTIGTQAAAEYVCRQDSLEQLLLRLSVSENGVLKPFEAVLHVKIARGVPVVTDLVALREVAQ